MTTPNLRPIPPTADEWLDEVNEQLDPPAYVTISVELAGETAVDHVDRLNLNDNLLVELARTINIDPHRITVIVTIDNTFQPTTSRLGKGAILASRWPAK